VSPRLGRRPTKTPLERPRPPVTDDDDPRRCGRAILLLLDREADRFLATRCDVDAMLVKPFDGGTLRRVVKGIFSASPS
jgi:hypothetical protein